jgi:hypothetical protein
MRNVEALRRPAPETTFPSMAPVPAAIDAADGVDRVPLPVGRNRAAPSRIAAMPDDLSPVPAAMPQLPRKASTAPMWYDSACHVAPALDLAVAPMPAGAVAGLPGRPAPPPAGAAAMGAPDTQVVRVRYTESSLVAGHVPVPVPVFDACDRPVGATVRSARGGRAPLADAAQAAKGPNGADTSHRERETT